ncbi:hypothetical protein [Planomicrobium sp. MB-3u-38]|uniref:hypothetical protein n=1 Tax=Planomicrobium sp. MB-3u-38 TaxID=2058318 RepID=UPI000C7CD0A6|nr:hypothetical protein [Planomicrobium sp. MB-3u-38]PKH10328.1 hypothetical protein CXF70_10280 [Planomicrobium sp. MB-3u-38]
MFAWILNYEYVLQIASVLAFIGPVIVMVINNYNITSIEKILLTNMNKVIHTTVTIIFYSLCIGVLTNILALFLEPNFTVGQHLLIFGIVFSIAFILFLIFIGSIFSLINLLRIKTTFYILDKDNQKWHIVRRINKKQILFKGEKNNKRFLEASKFYEEEIFQEIERENSQDKFFQLKTKTENIILWGSALLLIGVQGILLFSDTRDHQYLIYLGLFLLFSLICIIPLVSKTNKKIYSRIRAVEETT